VSTLTAPTTDVDVTTDVLCEAMSPEDDCGAPAELRVRSHTHPGFHVCWGCWDADRGRRGICRATYRIETRDEHFEIVRWLR
jgi:hypothetical protein